jgi:DNA processing protein
MVDENLAIWALSGVKGLGFAGLRRLLERFGKASVVLEQSPGALADNGFINDKIAAGILKEKDWDRLETDYRESFPDNASFMSVTDPKYPQRLRNISDPPTYFYYSGTLEKLNKPCLAVVGSRQPSDYGRRITRAIVGELAASGVTIVSGLAFGIDSAAHDSALGSGGATAAVFGNGLDIIYPAGNRKLAEEIRKAGCLISEFPKGTKPEPYNFPVRNRIISGLSEGVLVVEAREKSGALITANLAAYQGREVMAVPGNIDNELSKGPNSLLRQGAIPISSAQDIFDYFRWHKSQADARIARVKPNLSGEEKIVFDHLSVQPIHLDDLMRKTGLGPGKTAEVLLKLELQDLIMRKPGNFIVLS